MTEPTYISTSKVDFFGILVEMHKKFGFFQASEGMDFSRFASFLDFRFSAQIQEEVIEATDAIKLLREGVEEGNVKKINEAIHEINDAIIDILVFTFGTATFTMTRDELENSFLTVMEANFKKEAGIKPGRPNPFGLPDLLKPEGWQSPDITIYSKYLTDQISSRVRASDVKPLAA